MLKYQILDFQVLKYQILGIYLSCTKCDTQMYRSSLTYWYKKNTEIRKADGW